MINFKIFNKNAMSENFKNSLILGGILKIIKQIFKLSKNFIRNLSQKLSCVSNL